MGTTFGMLGIGDSNEKYEDLDKDPPAHAKNLDAQDTHVRENAGVRDVI